MSVSVNEGESVLVRHDGAIEALGVLTAIAIVPWVLLIVSEIAGSPVNLFHTSLSTLAFFNVAHVGLTGFFWFDRRYRAQIQQKPGFFYVFPSVVTVLVLAAVLVFGRVAYLTAVVGNASWLAYHFGKQNWGVVNLAATATQSDRPPSWLRHAYVVASIGGAVPIWGAIFEPSPLLDAARSVGLVLVVGGSVLALA
jgi:hypothetical protein